LHLLSLLVNAVLQERGQLSLVVQLQRVANALLDDLQLFLLRKLVQVGRQVDDLLSGLRLCLLGLILRSAKLLAVSILYITSQARVDLLRLDLMRLVLLELPLVRLRLL
jgi:hypothetical protein